jgi:hypothetical protein
MVLTGNHKMLLLQYNIHLGSKHNRWDIKITLLIKQRCIQNPNIIKKLITSKGSLQICKEIKKKKKIGCDAG